MIPFKHAKSRLSPHRPPRPKVSISRRQERWFSLARGKWAEPTPQASTSSPRHSWGRFVQARPTMCPVASRCQAQRSTSTAIKELNSRKSSHNTPHCCGLPRTVLCYACQQRPLTRHRPASTCAPAPLLGRRRAVLLHAALLALSATHSATAGPRPLLLVGPGPSPPPPSPPPRRRAASRALPRSISARAACSSQSSRRGPAVQRSTRRHLSLSDT